MEFVIFNAGRGVMPWELEGTEQLQSIDIPDMQVAVMAAVRGKAGI